MIKQTNEFYDLIKAVSDLNKFYGDLIDLEYRIFNVYAPFLARELLYEKDRKHVMFELKKYKIQIVDKNQTTGLDIKNKIITVSKKHLNIPAVICEEIAHAFKYIQVFKNKTSNYNDYIEFYLEENVLEYFGQLGILAWYLKFGIPEDMKYHLINWRKYKVYIDLYLKFSDPKEGLKNVYNEYLEILKFFGCIPKICRKKRCRNCRIHKEAMNELFIAAENIEKIIDLFVKYPCFTSHVFGYYSAEIDVLEEKKNLKELFNQPIDTVKKRFLKYLPILERLRYIYHSLIYVFNTIKELDIFSRKFKKEIKKYEKNLELLSIQSEKRKRELFSKNRWYIENVFIEKKTSIRDIILKKDLEFKKEMFLKRIAASYAMYEILKKELNFKNV